jgi:hypothetical protein
MPSLGPYQTGHTAFSVMRKSVNVFLSIVTLPPTATLTGFKVDFSSTMNSDSEIQSPHILAI